MPGQGRQRRFLPGGLGLDVAATGLLGRENAGVFEALFRAKRIEDRFADGATRTNIKLVDSDATTDINLPGLTATGELLTEAEATLLTLAEPGALVVLAGSLPLGCPPDHYGRLIARLQSRGVRVLLDTSGDALADALAGPALPWAIKPNRDELAEWAGQPLNTVRHIAAQAQRLREQGLGLVAVSMGEQGALFATEHGVLHAQLPATAVASTVGAGDAMVAGIAAALAEQADTERVARLAVAFAVAKLGLAGQPALGDHRRRTGRARVAAAHLDSGKPSMNKIWIAIEAGGSAVAALASAAPQGGHGTRLGLRYRNPQRRRHAAGLCRRRAQARRCPAVDRRRAAVPQAGLARGVAGLDEALAAPDRVIAAAIAQGQAPDTARAGARGAPPTPRPLALLAPAPNASLPSRPAPPASPILSWRPRV